MTGKTAVVLFNLGGPDGPDAIEPFLFNLFYDPTIFQLPNPFRWLLAKLVARRRTPTAKEIYAHLGGSSPLLAQTKKQAAALETNLNQIGTDDFRVFIAMRYWHPLTPECVAQVKDYDPDQVVLLPLYPQFSTTTTGSSDRAWRTEAKKQGLNVAHRTICCYPDQADFIGAYVEKIRAAIEDQPPNQAPSQPWRLLFSAHGLPKKVIDAGDPYQVQIERGAAAIVERLSIDGLDWSVCYQSRVGPMEWIGPSTDQEIMRAGADGKSVVLVPIAFVSEHSETLVELDIEYRELAAKENVPGYIRVATLGDHPSYIDALSKLTLQAVGETQGCGPASGLGICPAHRTACPCIAGNR